MAGSIKYFHVDGNGKLAPGFTNPLLKTTHNKIFNSDKFKFLCQTCRQIIQVRSLEARTNHWERCQRGGAIGPRSSNLVSTSPMTTDKASRKILLLPISLVSISPLTLIGESLYSPLITRPNKRPSNKQQTTTSNKSKHQQLAAASEILSIPSREIDNDQVMRLKRRPRPLNIRNNGNLTGHKNDKNEIRRKLQNGENEKVPARYQLRQRSAIRSRFSDGQWVLS